MNYGGRKQTPSARLPRLRRELQELRDEPMRGIKVNLHEDDFTKMCLILTPHEGPFRGLRLHLGVDVPEGYPRVAPNVTIQTPVSHPNVFGNTICADILQAHQKMGYGADIRSASGYNGGYTPGYLLKYIFLQLLSFFSENEVEQSGGYKHSITYGDSGGKFKDQMEQIVRQYECGLCGFNKEVKVVLADSELRLEENGGTGTKSTASTPKQPGKGATSGCTVDELTDDCWLHIFEFLPDRDIMILSDAYPRAKRLVHAYNILIQRQLICFYLRKSYQECVLGVGVEINRRDLLIREFDLFSYEAFKDHGLREGIWGVKFTHFLPVALTNVHFRKSLPIIRETLFSLSGNSGAWKPSIVLSTIPRMMNMMVVNLMRACDEEGDNYRSNSNKALKASEKALQGYCLLLHLFTMLADEYPEIRQEAQQKIELFMQNRTNRHKNTTPNLGEFMIYLLLAKDVNWNEFCACFLEELLARNVVWFLTDKPYLAYLEKSSYLSQLRLRETFDASGTSLRLVMFQVAFLRMTQSTDEMNRRYGYPSEEMSLSLLKLIKEIYVVKDWDVFFRMLNYPLSDERVVAGMLIAAVQQSQESGYHQVPYSNSELFYLRRQVENHIAKPADGNLLADELERLRISGCVRGLNFMPGGRNGRDNQAKRENFARGDRGRGRGGDNDGMGRGRGGYRGRGRGVRGGRGGRGGGF